MNLWLLRAARAVVQGRRPDLLYVATTDYMQHRYGPDSAGAQAHHAALDAEIGLLVDAWPSLHPDGAVSVTADHGMRDKTTVLGPGAILRRREIDAKAAPNIKDRYVVHHGNQGARPTFTSRTPPRSATDLPS